MVRPRNNNNNHNDDDYGDNIVLSKIIVQPNGADACAVVLHSTIASARVNTGVYGSSSGARVGGASSDPSGETRIITQMLRALSSIPGMPAVETSADNMIEGDGGYVPLLHR